MTAGPDLLSTGEARALGNGRHYICDCFVHALARAGSCTYPRGEDA